MEINRNQYFLAGLVLLFLGLQFHFTDSLVLTSECASMLDRRAGQLAIGGDKGVDVLPGAQVSLPPKMIRPPEWLGWALLSLGSVLILHSMAMRRPD